MPDASDLGPCPNCGTPPAGRFCAACGQDNRRRELRLGEQFVDAFNALFSLDSRLLRTLRELSYAPGGVVRRYVQGQRIRYLPPMRYALFTCALWWLSVGMQLTDMSKFPRELRTYLGWAQWINLALLPPLAVPFWLAFLGTKTRFAEHLTYLFFAAGHMFLVRGLLAFLGFWLPMWGVTLNRIDGILFPAYLALTLWGWQRPRPGNLRTHAMLLARIAVGIALLILASGYMVGASVRFLLWILP